ncbi:N-acetyltransferase [Streptomyces sp. ms191]|uniref:GNAT family N-acetyltransferase n=1 Tax=unclassified Streptomyces TaxID=2593676 RepID=UPI0011CE2833|nr:GNAT family protein [Streptomyces sp. ms191]TXS33319.1 N-acetyltransferase [Streptomyces sp. ms191]
MPVPVVLAGRTVRLEPLAMRHAEGLAWAGALDRAAYAYTPVPDGLDAACDYIARALTDQAAGRTLPFAMVSMADGRVVGSTRFLELDYWRGPLVWPPTTGVPHGDPLTSVPDAVEIGNTWISAETRGSGINAESKLLMLRHAFEIWGVRRVTMRADARNLRSRAAIERLGATCEGVRRAHSRGLDGVVRDTAFYSILDEEWPAVRDMIQLRLSSSRMVGVLDDAYPGEYQEHGGGSGQLLLT